MQQQPATDPTPDSAAELVESVNPVQSIFATLEGMVSGFFSTLPKIAVGIVVFLVFLLVAKGVQALVRKLLSAREEGNYGGVFSKLAYWAVLIFGLLVAITIVVPTMSPGDLISSLGIGGVAIGFAFKDIFQNLLAGVLLLVRQPFRVGDEITSGNYTGKVESIETRATYIQTYDGKRIIIPNSQIYQEPVSVITAYEKVRQQYDVGIGYGDDMAQAQDVALEAVRGVDGVLSDPAPDCLVWDLAGSSVNLRVRWWSHPQRGEVVHIRSEVLKQVANALSNAGIDLPFPTQVTLFHDQTEAVDGDRTRQREGWPAGETPPKPNTVADAIRGAADKGGQSAAGGAAKGAGKGAKSTGKGASGSKSAKPAQTASGPMTRTVP